MAKIAGRSRIRRRIEKRLRAVPNSLRTRRRTTMKIKHLLPVFAGCAMIALATLTATAQTGRLEGDVVKADTKEPIVGAEVQIERTDIKGSYPVKSDKKGHFLH